METEFQQQSGEEEAENPVTPGELIGFVFRAARRHRVLGIAVGICVGVLGLSAAQVMPQKYEAESRLLVEDAAQQTSNLSNPDTARPRGDPIAGTVELLLQKTSLMALAKEANLLSHWEKTRIAPLRLKDWLLSLVRGPISDEEKLEVLAEILENRVFCNRQNDLLTVRVQWHEPQMAKTLAEIAQRRFLEALRNQEVQGVKTAISILEKEAERAGKEIDPALQKVLKAREEAIAEQAPSLPVPATGLQVARAGPRALHAAPAVAAVAAVAPVGDQPKRKLSGQLEDVREEIRAAQTRWQQRRAQLEAELTELNATYGPEHPLVVQQRTKIAVASKTPQDVADLQQRKTQILSQLEAIPDPPPAPPPDADPPPGPHRSVPTAVAAAVRQPRRLSTSSRGTSEDDENPVVTAAMSRLRSAIDRYERVSSRIDTARIELISVQAAFDFRYIVVGHPELPKNPRKPIRLILTLGSVVGAVVLGLLTGALRQLISGKIHESWQVKTLGLVNLGEFELPGREEPSPQWVESRTD